MSRVQIPQCIAEQALLKLMRIGDRLWRESDERFAQWGIADNHYNVLRILNGAGQPLSQIEIGRRMLSSRANVTKLIDVLEEKKFVKRLACGDRRVKLISLTDAGARFLQDTLQQVQGSVEQTLHSLSKTEQKNLSDLLEKIM